MAGVYRCYYLGRDGHFVSAESAELESLEDAIRHCSSKIADQVMGLVCRGFEIWHGQECLHRYEPSARDTSNGNISAA
jgi:hypothetical protein